MCGGKLERRKGVAWETLVRLTGGWRDFLKLHREGGRRPQKKYSISVIGIQDGAEVGGRSVPRLTRDGGQKTPQSKGPVRVKLLLG